MSWFELDRRHCWHPYTQHGEAPDPLPVASAQGAWLTLRNGRRLLDAISSWWCCLHGHGHPDLVRAMGDQAASLDHVLFAGCAHEPAARLASELVSMAPSGLTRVFFSDNGSTAVEVALKAAYQACKMRDAPRKTFLALDGGYHGDTFGAMAVGDPDPFFRHFGPLLFEVVRSAPTEDALNAAFAAHGDQLAAFILEPRVQGANGMTPVPDAVMQRARALCDDYGVALIADEVFTGFGRTGCLFACGGAGVSPDALCLSKGLTGGMLPLAVTMFQEEVFERFRTPRPDDMFVHGHTFTANPIACAVAGASLQVIKSEKTPDRFQRIGQRIFDAVAPLGDRPSTNVRHVGGIVAVELLGDDPGYWSLVGPRLRQACITHAPDVLFRPMGNVLYAVPPACTTLAECELIAKRMVDVVAALDAR